MIRLYYKIKKKLGYNTIREYEDEKHIKEYKVLHTNGEVSIVRANYYITSGAFAKFYRYTDECYYATNVHLFFKYKECRVLESIQEIETVNIIKQKLRAEKDLSTGKIVETEIIEQ